jgi:hypothetical protein
MRKFAYRDRRMHMGIPVCVRAGIAKKFAYRDPITHNEFVRTRGLTYTLCKTTHLCCILMVFCSYLEYNAVTPSSSYAPFRSLVIYQFLHMISIRTGNSKKQFFPT